MTPRPVVPSNSTFNYSVHGARGLFAFAIFVFHIVNSGLPVWTPLQWRLPDMLLRSTEYGVELFFCISGFVIAGTLRRARSPQAFLTDRAIRIYPVLSVTVLTITVLGLLSDTHGFEYIDATKLAWMLPANLLGLPGILPMNNLHPAAWSLSYELAFYLACAVGWAARRRLGSPVLWLGVPAAVLMIGTYPRAVFLLVGVLVAEARWVAAPVVRRLAANPIPMLLIFLLAWREIQVLSLPTHIIDTTMFQWASDWRLPLAIVGILAALVAFTGIATGRGWLGQALCAPVLQYLGTISYSFYLWHPIVMSVTKFAMLRFGLVAALGDASWLGFFVLALPPALIVAHISQRLLERRVGLWLRSRLHHPAPLQTVAVEASAATPATLGVR